MLLGENFTPLQYSLMVGMIVMSLLPQILTSLRARKEAITV
ncbi:permease of the drug/metabolite transporter domain protein [Vibrio parahaemolyticus V-223/04]|nr:permease of the drug/metabolite transporter domain protein [Vibrio parahaemolyticus V-223/04]